MLDNLSDDQEKSVALAKAMGWDIKPHGRNTLNMVWDIFDDFGSVGIMLGKSWNLYDPANMALAWRVLNWANKSVPFNSGDDIWRQWEGWWDGLDIKGEYPADAQRLWLDKILELAIEAGIVEMSEEFWHEYYGDVRADDLVSGTGIV